MVIYSFNQIKGLSILKVKNRMALHIFPILMIGRGNSDASRRLVTWGIEIYNQIINHEYVSCFKNPDTDSRNGGARYVA